MSYGRRGGASYHRQIQLQVTNNHGHLLSSQNPG
jgi:hypothetical protein